MTCFLFFFIFFQLDLLVMLQRGVQHGKFCVLLGHVYSLVILFYCAITGVISGSHLNLLALTLDLISLGIPEPKKCNKASECREVSQPLAYYIYLETWNQTLVLIGVWALFWRGLTFTNRGHWGRICTIYIYLYVMNIFL